MIAVAFPEAEAIFAEKQEAADPLDGFPGIKMRDDEAKRATMLGAERFAVVGVREKNIGASEVGERDVGGVALFGEDEGVLGGRRGLDEPKDLGEEDTSPAIVEAAPAGDAMEVRGDFGLRQGEKFLPGKFCRSGNFAGDFEIPGGFVEMRDAAVVENRPLEGERLAGRETAFGAGLVFELFAIAV